MDVQIINSNDALQALNRSEIDIQISTAKQYPRDLDKVLSNIRKMATLDEETAEDCFYALKRGYGNDQQLIEGLSVRLAEIFVASWGNIRVATRIIGNDGKTITAQGACHDLETNVAVNVEVKRRITDKQGRTYSEDMQVVTGNAASAIAFRNAVFKVIPKAVTKKVINEIKQMAIGKANDLEKKRAAAIAWFKGQGVEIDDILKYLEVDCIESIDAEKFMTLRATANAVKEGTTTIAETFHPRRPTPSLMPKGLKITPPPTSPPIRRKRLQVKSVKK
jgi:phosphoribosylformylglycinamidine (FGAM) synthase PurS component